MAPPKPKIKLPKILPSAKQAAPSTSTPRARVPGPTLTSRILQDNALANSNAGSSNSSLQVNRVVTVVSQVTTRQTATIVTPNNNGVPPALVPSAVPRRPALLNVRGAMFRALSQRLGMGLAASLDGPIVPVVPPPAPVVPVDPVPVVRAPVSVYVAPAPVAPRKKKSGPSVKKSHGSYGRAYKKILKQVNGAYPRQQISQQSVDIIDCFMVDIFERLVTESVSLLRQTGRKTITPLQLEHAVTIVMGGERLMSKTAKLAGQKALQNLKENS